MTRKALFLDRDGVVNIDTGYLHEPNECVFVEGIFELVSAANHAGWPVVLVTNQAGIGRGYFTVAQFQAFTEWMLGEFQSRGARIDRVYYCPHHPEFGLGEYRQACACRKPQPGMFVQARADLDLDMEGSLMIGDKPSDLLAAARAGVAHRFLFAPAGEFDLELTESLGSRIDSLSELPGWFGQDRLREPQPQSDVIADLSPSARP
ncbi:D-glycero-beta-D-manno-heptose 1,7-bisphosphate 7-phosphatase [Paraburkholderia sp. UYCP14C]|uniref:D-glycero-beta-D-manno-heptose 1,7-bisphosphate 7-phosphatase n=1 Tax=Paraburkholderia sp. UYCP14C TaxID=2511130 RepID=UPI00101F0E37|nr:D-glycero-beta-D-manno-heptose 1,7-bisphosphate 7-phosphatase [Paraburkholderia sp. UYCP14C]RZF30725.1 D-glycero-beta-D-manno-heptose 1,7-bisphosphate 7-phosphatase [Paraburkholderia sp. UYCP14C]